MKKVLLALVGVAAAASAANAQYSIVNNLPGSFVDISAFGTFIDSTDDSEHAIITTIGNQAFPAGNVLLGNNGAAVAGLAAGQIGFTNATIGVTGVPAGMPAGGTGYMLPLWDDHIPTTAATSGIYYMEIGPVLIVQWNQEDHFGAPGTGTATFQLQVFSVGDVLAQYVYADTFYSDGAAVNNGGSATIGYVANPGNAAQNNVLHSFNTQSIADGSVLSLIVPAPASAALLGLGGLVAIRRRRA
ncbi:MAG: PEP-CTERM sorting domain-containing protein [Phycisphaerales bacterium]|nr:PEP-CTERM sorting domain-containing protein [Phycisphaerales bacterium]